jgi:hypothetical protein
MSLDDLQMVAAEVEGICRQMGVRGESLRVLDVDVEVGAVKGYRGVSSLEEIAGRGGTDMGAGTRMPP